MDWGRYSFFITFAEPLSPACKGFITLILLIILLLRVQIAFWVISAGKTNSI